MKKTLFGILLAVFLGSLVFAQQSSVVKEEMTITNAGVVAFDAATLTALTRGTARCNGVLEDGEIRFSVAPDAATISTTSGTPLLVDRFVEINGRVNISQFRAIAQTATDGKIFWNCFR